MIRGSRETGRDRNTDYSDISDIFAYESRKLDYISPSSKLIRIPLIQECAKRRTPLGFSAYSSFRKRVVLHIL